MVCTWPERKARYDIIKKAGVRSCYINYPQLCEVITVNIAMATVTFSK